MILSKRIYNDLKKEKKKIDWLMWFAAVFGPATMLPQVVLVYANKSAANLSIITWILAVTLCVIYLLYAIIHRIKPMIIANLLWLSLYGFLVIGIAIYH